FSRAGARARSSCRAVPSLTWATGDGYRVRGRGLRYLRRRPLGIRATGTLHDVLPPPALGRHPGGRRQRAWRTTPAHAAAAGVSLRQTNPGARCAFLITATFEENNTRRAAVFPDTKSKRRTPLGPADPRSRRGRSLATAGRPG